MPQPSNALFTAHTANACSQRQRVVDFAIGIHRHVEDAEHAHDCAAALAGVWHAQITLRQTHDLRGYTARLSQAAVNPHFGRRQPQWRADLAQDANELCHWHPLH